MNGASCSPAREFGQVEDQMNALHMQVENLSNAVHRMEDRLCTVVRCQEPAIANGISPPDVNVVPLADGIRSAQRRLYSIREQVENIMARLEL